MTDTLQVRIQGDASLPTLIYCPGMHGDWTLAQAFRQAIASQVRLVEMTYPLQRWDLPDYARHVEAALLAKGIMTGWLLGESFGSQVAWWLTARSQAKQALGKSGFAPQGIILAGGFVRYPLPLGVVLVRAMQRKLTLQNISLTLRAYVKFMRWRHRNNPVMQGSLDEFLVNRGTPGDQAVIQNRYDLILGSDPRSVASHTQLPVYYLTGFWDFIVPWVPVLLWLKRRCKTFKGTRVVWMAEHNILGSAPKVAAEQIVKWIKSEAV
ncbi:MAG: alpha/beta hydrolase [Verrucomicrobiota bacterium]